MLGELIAGVALAAEGDKSRGTTFWDFLGSLVQTNPYISYILVGVLIVIFFGVILIGAYIFWVARQENRELSLGWFKMGAKPPVTEPPVGSEEGTSLNMGLCRLDGRIYGLIRKRTDITLEIDKDLGAKSRHSTVLEALAPVPAVEHFGEVPSQEGDGEGEAIGVSESGGDARVSFEPVLSTRRECWFIVRFTPPLVKGQTQSYNYTQKFPAKSFASSLAELQGRKLEHDYYAATIQYPTEHLALQVLLPPGFKSKDIGCAVWFGRAHLPHEGEVARLKDNFSWDTVGVDQRTKLALDVPYPLRGLSYAIRWKPSN